MRDMLKKLIIICLLSIVSVLFAENDARQLNNRVTPTVKAVAQVLPSVVNIGTERIVPYYNSQFGAADPFEQLFRKFYEKQIGRKETSLGSGAIINKEGLVVTNAHVVHKATRIYITDNNGHQYLAKEIAADDLNDISLLKLESKFPLDLTPIDFARADEPVMLGETVIAVGNPYGLGSSISKGIVSAIGRKVTYKGKVLFDDILQTDAPINPGNSGGPLVNINGELIGLNTAIFEQANSIGFAIPLKRIEKVLAMWLIPERFSDVTLGLIPGEIVKSGNTIFKCREIISGSPADKAGLQKNDEILMVNGKKIKHLMDISNELWQLKGGDLLSLTIKEKGNLTLTVEKLEALDGEKLIAQKLGVQAVKLTKQLAGQLKYPFYDGLIVNEISSQNPALSRGDVIVKIGDVPIYDYADIRRALNGKYYGDKVKALVIFGAKKFGKKQLYKKNVLLNVL